MRACVSRAVRYNENRETSDRVSGSRTHRISASFGRGDRWHSMADHATRGGRLACKRVTRRTRKYLAAFVSPRTLVTPWIDRACKNRSVIFVFKATTLTVKFNALRSKVCPFSRKKWTQIAQYGNGNFSSGVFSIRPLRMGDLPPWVSPTPSRKIYF